MKVPLVSIIIPTFNNEKTISTIIERVLGQPYEEIELIVVNDGSSDATAEVVGGYAKKDKRVLVSTQANKGASAARNAGIGLMKGDYVLFFDADDDVDAGMIGAMVEAQGKYTNSLVVCGKQVNGEALLPQRAGIVDENVKLNVVKSILKDGLLYSPCNKIYRTDIIRKNGLLFDERIGYGEDLIFNLAYLEYADSIYYVREPFYIYHLSNGGYSAKNAKNKKYRMAMYAALEKYVGDDSKSLRLSATMKLVRLRWAISVQKAKLVEGKRG